MIKKEDIKKLAKLAKLNIEESKLDELTKQMNIIVDFANEINKIACDDIDNDNSNNLYNVLRDDVVGKSFDREDILLNADGGFDGYFSVKR